MMDKQKVLHQGGKMSESTKIFNFLKDNLKIEKEEVWRTFRSDGHFNGTVSLYINIYTLTLTNPENGEKIEVGKIETNIPRP
jgi:hypothetical protein